MWLIILCVVFFICLKFPIQLQKNKATFITNGISQLKFLFLQLSPLLYVLSVAGAQVPGTALNFFRPIPIGLLLLLPGIFLGTVISKKMQSAGIDTAVNSSRIAQNVMWLGIGIGIYITVTIIISLLVTNVTELPNG